MGLSDPKVRILFSDDPQNKRWAEDTSKFGYQMLQKMGWKPGKGLGVGEQGQTKHLTLAVKRDHKGLGSVPNQYTSATDDYAQLLAKLNVAIEPTLSSPAPEIPVCRNPSRLKFIKQKKLSTASKPIPGPSPCEIEIKTKPTPSTDIHGFMQGGMLIGDHVIPNNELPSLHNEKQYKKSTPSPSDSNPPTTKSSSILATPEPSIDLSLESTPDIKKSKKRKREKETENERLYEETKEKKRRKKEEKEAKRECKRRKKEEKNVKKALKKRHHASIIPIDT